MTMVSAEMVFDLAQYSFTWLGGLYAGVALSILLLGSVVLGKEKFSFTGIIFFLGCFSVFCWFNADAAMVMSESYEVSLFWGRMTVQGFFLGAAAMYHATIIILDLYDEERISVAAFWLFGLLFTVLGMSSSFIIDGIYEYPWGRYPKYSTSGLSAVFYVYAMFFMVFRKFWLKFREIRSPSREFHILRLMVIGFGCAMVATVDWLPAYGIYLPPLGSVFLVGCVGIFTHIIVNHTLDPMTPEFAADEIVSTMSDGLLVADQDGTIQMVNEAITTMLGYSADELEGGPLDRLTDQTYLGGELSGYETRISRRDGEETDVSVSSSRLEDWGGNLLGWIMVLRDIQDRKETERKLRESEERFRQLAENIEDVFWLYDRREETFLYWSPSYEDVFDESIDRAPQTAREWAQRVARGTKESSADQLRQGLKSGEEFVVDYRLEGSDDDVWVSERAVPVKNEAGEVYRVAGLVRDVTEVRRKNQMIREKNRDLEQFAHAASHDLQEPLRQLLTFCEFTHNDLDEGDEESVRRDIEDIRDSVETMDELVQALLRLSQVGRDPLDVQEIDLGECVEPVIDSFAETVHEKEATIHRPEEWPSLKADPELLRQVLRNLIDNALRYSGAGTTVEILVESGSDATVVGVRDDGPGIDPGCADRVFRPFERLQGNGGSGGAGMGLGICKKIIERHGGDIWLNPNWEDGTYVQFSLPNNPGQQNEFETEEANTILSSPEDPATF